MIEIIRADNTKITGVTSISIRDSIDELLRGLEITSDKTALGLKLGEKIIAKVDGEQYLTGYVYSLKSNNKAKDSTNTASVKSSLVDLLDSSLPDVCKRAKKGSTLKAIAQNVLKELGMTVSVTGVDSDAFKSYELTEGEDAQNAFDFLDSLARKRAVYFNEDEEGNLEIIKYDIDKKEDIKLTCLSTSNSNIIESVVGFTDSGQFNRYVVKSQLETNQDYSKGVFVKGEATDSGIRETRYREIIASENMNKSECKSRADEEANLRRVKGFSYSCKVQGHSYEGTPYKKGMTAMVLDEKTNVYGLYLVKSVVMNYSRSGSSTDLELTYADAYTGQAVIDQKNARKEDLSNWK